MAKRHVLCFDGTWDDPDKRTNVEQFYEAVKTVDEAAGVIGQRAWYHKGVGTELGSLVLGGAFGVGLSQNMLDGYVSLSREYRDGDAIFIVGFSRGAYTARCLASLISKCGVLLPANADDQNTVLNAYLYAKMRGADAPRLAGDFCAAYGRRAPITFVGVWDTVGALGLPGRFFQPLDEALFGFVDLQLAAAVERAYHALAVDEHRYDFRPALWQGRTASQTMEQRWFAGDHSDVGGGYPRTAARDPALSDIPLAWMMGKAMQAGLALDAARIPGNLAACVKPKCDDAYTTFLDGEYAKKNPPYFRPIGASTAGNEIVDDSVYDKRAQDPTYRPKNSGLRPL